MGLIGLVVKIVVAIVLVIVGLGAYLYFTDYEAKATVTETGKDGTGSYAIVTPNVYPYHYRQALDANSALFVCKGYHVTFTVQTHHVVVFAQDAKTIVYDSTKSPPLQNAPTLVKCALNAS